MASQTLKHLLLVFAFLFVTCKDSDDADEADEKPSQAEDASPPDPSADDEQNTGPLPQRMLKWLDPEATAVAFSRVPAEIDMQLLSTVFALPPRVTSMLRNLDSTLEDLEVIQTSEDQPEPEQWLTTEALAMTPSVATGTYVIRGLERPRDEVESMLEAADMRRRTVEGFTMFEPRGALPWKLVFLEDDLLGFIPAKEIGSGLGPLTSGRDLPASEVETELRNALKQDATVLLELLATGPLLHLDLGQDILTTRFGIRPWKDGGLDAIVAFEPARDATVGAKALESRETPLETDVIQRLVDEVAFTAEGKVIQGRLQLGRKDVRALHGSS